MEVRSNPHFRFLEEMTASINGTWNRLRNGSLKILLTLCVWIAGTAAQSPQAVVTVYMIGDSTMANKDPKAYPETGWGMPFAYFFDDSVRIDNRAKNGRSTKTFLSENLWQPVYENLKQGDYVFIQFGHNDESVEKKERYATPPEYQANLERFIGETRAKGAIPVLLTPVSRRKFDSKGNAVETHTVYSDLVRKVAAKQQVAFIDLDKESQALYQQFGEVNSRHLFLQLKPGEHPNYPAGKEDNTHFNELGARLIAQLVLADLRKFNLPLTRHIVSSEAK